ncbi:hypothetical protein chiPu_0031496, partial [Chiloscyllium punctatum]|nr:hypothetical protein [Chiloscyllium punctatum]
LGDVRPALGVVAVDLEPLFQARLGVRLDGVGRTFRLAYAAIDAFVRMDDQHVLALVEAIDGADLDAVGIFTLDAGFSDDVGHPKLRNDPLFLGLRSAGIPEPQGKPAPKNTCILATLPAGFVGSMILSRLARRTGIAAPLGKADHLEHPDAVVERNGDDIARLHRMARRFLARAVEADMT